MSSMMLVKLMDWHFYYIIQFLERLENFKLSFFVLINLLFRFWVSNCWNWEPACCSDFCFLISCEFRDPILKVYFELFTDLTVSKEMPFQWICLGNNEFWVSNYLDWEPACLWFLSLELRVEFRDLTLEVYFELFTDWTVSWRFLIECN